MAVSPLAFERRAVLVAILCIGSLMLVTPLGAQTAPANANISAQEFLRRAINGEIKAQANDHSHWMYESQDGEGGHERTKLVIETRDGDLDRLLAVDGHPISAEQQKQEAHRVDKLLHRHEEEKKRKHAKQEDEERTERLFKLLPEAVTATYGQHQGDLIEINFRPNPAFHPQSHEANVFHAMEGRIWINSRQNRLAEIEGHLMKEVKFGAGLLGYLREGGEFHVKQTEIAPGNWEITLLHVNMQGKALFFKTISVQENERRRNFQRVPDDMTLEAAAQELQKRCEATSQAASVDAANSATRPAAR